MDPNLFHVDWERTFEALVLIIILAFVVERALAVLFEVPIIVARVPSGAKALVAVGVSIWVCYVWHFDALSIIILAERTSVPGYIVTGAVIAGGSKASIKLFHDLLDVKSTAVREAEPLKQLEVQRTVERGIGRRAAARAAAEIASLEAATKAAAAQEARRRDAETRDREQARLKKAAEDAAAQEAIALEEERRARGGGGIG